MFEAGVHVRDRRERLLLWGVRRCALGCRDMRVVEAAFIDACGERDGHIAYVAVRSLLIILALHGRRRLALHPPCCSQRTLDEQALLGLFSAAASGAAAEMEARLAWLVRPSPTIDAVRLLSAAAAALRLAEDEASAGPPWSRPTIIEMDAASGLEHHAADDPACPQIVERRVDGR